MRLFVALLLACAPVAIAKPRMPHNDVPLDRLVAACKKQIAATPADPRAYYVLGRLYSLAFVGKRAKVNGVFNPDGRSVPYLASGGMGKPRYADALKIAKPFYGKVPADRLGSGALEAPAGQPDTLKKHPWLAYLDLSIHWYRKAIEKKADHHAALLGLAWALEAAQQAKLALEQYRAVYDIALPKAMAAGKRYPGSSNWDGYAMEAGARMMALLAKGPARTKIATELAKVGALPEGRLPISPVVVPLGANTRYPALLSKRVATFDLAGLGDRQRWRWVTPDAALLVWDPRGRGRVRDGRQLFGHGTWGVQWDHGYQPLALLDRDGDGWIAGRERRGLALWRDAGRAGVSEPGELRPLSECVRRLSVRATIVQREAVGPIWGARAELTDGRAVPTYDWLAEPSGSKR